jgi:hypothetical protein
MTSNKASCLSTRRRLLESDFLPETPPTDEQGELQRLIGLRVYLEADDSRFLYRHHLRAASGKVTKRMTKSETLQLDDEHTLIKTEKLSPVISRRLLTREIQKLE